MTRQLATHLVSATLGAVIAISLVAFGAISIGVVSAQSGSNLGCIDSNGNGVVDISELFDVIDAYFDGTPISSPEPEPTPGNLADATEANLWIAIFQDPDLPEYLQVRADTAFDVDAYALTVFVDGSEYCNPSRMYGDEGFYELSFEFEEKHHTSVQQVSAQTQGLGDLRCERNFQSTARETVFACVWR